MHNHGKKTKQISSLTYNIAIQLKEKLDAMVVDCHHVDCVVCLVTE